MQRAVGRAVSTCAELAKADYELYQALNLLKGLGIINR